MLLNPILISEEMKVCTTLDFETLNCDIILRKPVSFSSCRRESRQEVHPWFRYLQVTLVGSERL